eukprot:TRINITY_DN30394_c0_g1_i1.p1 TRINITY_DN30394_c0_g1~~TRINITY_DN30394_c0_g1_i1.p1  ORF type:complete len:674 (+),score=146.58 TRINITY_DN30394_c0_g1_i1:72-2093(+)
MTVTFLEPDKEEEENAGGGRRLADEGALTAASQRGGIMKLKPSPPGVVDSEPMDLSGNGISGLDANGSNTAYACGDATQPRLNGRTGGGLLLPGADGKDKSLAEARAAAQRRHSGPTSPSPPNCGDQAEEEVRKRIRELVEANAQELMRQLEALPPLRSASDSATAVASVMEPLPPGCIGTDQARSGARGSVASLATLMDYHVPSTHTEETVRPNGMSIGRCTRVMQEMQVVKDESQQSSINPRYATRQNRKVLPDSTEMKQVVKDAVCKPKYDVTNFYYETGYCQMVARSQAFEIVTLIVITLNALWIAVDLDHNKSPLLVDAEPVFLVAENLFCVYFVVELLIRFLAFEQKRQCCRDSWFVFDSCLVAIMILETWVMTLFFVLSGSRGQGMGDSSVLRLLKMLRLSRMARMVRLLRAFPELLALVKGIGVAARSVFFTACLMLSITYMFAVLLTQLTQDSAVSEMYFDTVPDAMKNLLISSIFPDMADMLNDTGMESWLWTFILTAFICLISLTLLNMLIGVLCEVVTVVSAMEKEELVGNFLFEELNSLLPSGSVDSETVVTKEDFCVLLWTPNAVRLLTEIGIDVVALASVVDVLFPPGKTYEYSDVVSLLLDLRGSNTATVKDVVDLRKFTAQMLDGLKDDIIDAISTMSASTRSTRRKGPSQCTLLA